MELSRDQIEELKARDSLFAAIDLGLMFRQHTESGHVLRVLLEALEGESRHAVEALARCSPLAGEEISSRLVTVRAYIFLRDLIGGIMLRAQAAEQTVAQMEATNRLDERPD